MINVGDFLFSYFLHKVLGRTQRRWAADPGEGDQVAESTFASLSLLLTPTVTCSAPSLASFPPFPPHHCPAPFPAQTMSQGLSACPPTQFLSWNSVFPSHLHCSASQRLLVTYCSFQGIFINVTSFVPFKTLHVAENTAVLFPTFKR